MPRAHTRLAGFAECALEQQQQRMALCDAMVDEIDADLPAGEPSMAFGGDGFEPF